MSEQRASLEIIAPTIEEAVSKGLANLQMSEDQVEIEVLDAGSRGQFGFGTRQARVRLTIKAAVVDTNHGYPIPKAETRPEVGVIKEPEPIVEPVEDVEYRKEADKFVSPVDELALDAAREIVIDLLNLMKVKAQVKAYYAEPEEARGRRPLWVDVRGKDLSILVGPHAETLNALQYIAGLIVSKELGHMVTLVVDVEGYRVRRSQEVRRLARRMADQAVKTGRKQVLEPMPASERRLVHIELRDNLAVTTESIGEEPHRKVTIIPK